MTTLTDAHFVTDDGVQLPLHDSHHAQTRIASTTGYGSEPAESFDAQTLDRWIASVDSRVALAQRMIDLGGGSIAGSSVCVVGASEGAEMLCLARRGAERIIGTNYGDEYEAGGALASRRSAVLGRLDPAEQERFSLRVDDLCRSSLEDQSVDLIMSWQTLEHVHDPAAAMRETARILRPGGIAFHEYNPFFAIDGGHSLCTLDIPWGHAILTDAEFERYIRQHRPQIADEAIAFRTRSLNRLSMQRLREHARDAGLSIVMLVPRTRTEDLLVLDRTTLDRGTAIHPHTDVADYISRIVRVVLRREA